MLVQSKRSTEAGLDHQLLELLARLADDAYARCEETPPHPQCPSGNGDGPSLLECNECLRQSYYTGSSDHIAYSCERRRWLYVVRYLPTNACGTFSVLADKAGWWEEVGPLIFTEKELRVLSWGCGPGSELLGTLMWLAEARRSPAPTALYLRSLTKVRLLGVDVQAEWRPALEKVGQVAARAYFDKVGLTDLSWELKQGATVIGQLAEFRPHILICSWLWSELENDGKAVSLWLAVAKASAKLGSPCLVLLSDRTEDRMSTRLDRLVKASEDCCVQLASACLNEYYDIPFTSRAGMLLPRKSMKSSVRVLLAGSR